MWIVLLIVCGLAEAFVVYRLIRDIPVWREWNKVKLEYNECFALEGNRVKDIPKKWHIVGRKQSRLIIAQLCGNLHIPPIKVTLSWRSYKGFGWASGMYIHYSLSQPEIYLKGLFWFDIVTLIHEVAHSHAEYWSNYYGWHGEPFLKSEGIVFDVFEQLLKAGVVK
jgi:hypothetical protein